MRDHLYSRLLSSRPLFVHFVRPITPQQLEWSRSLVDFSPPRIILFYFFFYKKTCRKTVIIIYVYLGPYSPPASAVATGAFFTEGGGHWSDLNRWSWAQTRAPIGALEVKPNSLLENYDRPDEPTDRLGYDRFRDLRNNVYWYYGII